MSSVASLQLIGSIFKTSKDLTPKLHNVEPKQEREQAFSLHGPGPFWRFHARLCERKGLITEASWVGGEANRFMVAIPHGS